MSVSKIKSTLPQGERNGLDAIADALAGDFADNPRKTRVIIAVIDCSRIQMDRAEDADDDVPPGLTATARIRRVEAVAPGDDSLARRLLARGYEHRLGRVTLPLDTEAEMFGVNPQTGEKRRGGED